MNFFHFSILILEMAEGNGEIIEEMATAVKTTETTVETERTPDYPKLVEYGLDKRVCGPNSSRPIHCVYKFFYLIFLSLAPRTNRLERWPVN